MSLKWTNKKIKSHYSGIYHVKTGDWFLAHLTWSLAGPKSSWISNKPVTSWSYWFLEHNKHAVYRI